MDTGGFKEFPVINFSVHYPPGYSYFRDKKPENLDALISRFQGGRAAPNPS